MLLTLVVNLLSSGHHSKHRPALKKIEPTTTKAQPRESGRGTPSSTSTMEDAKQQKERRLNELRKQINVDEVWKQVEANLSEVQLGIVPVPGWKTVRIFVSSTFKDFHQEREVLVKQVSISDLYQEISKLTVISDLEQLRYHCKGAKTSAVIFSEEGTNVFWGKVKFMG